MTIHNAMPFIVLMPSRPRHNADQEQADSLTILVVDDRADIARAMAMLLGMRGYHVVHRDSGEAALQYLAVAKPQLVLLDFMMPGMNGHEVLERIRSDPANGAIPVIMATATPTAQVRARAEELGAQGVLNKAEAWEVLVPLVDKLLRACPG